MHCRSPYHFLDDIFNAIAKVIHSTVQYITRSRARARARARVK